MARRGVDGSSDGPEWGPARQGEDVAAVVDAIGEPVYVLGHSYGAMCALEAALVTESIAKLILYEPPFTLPKIPAGVFDQITAMLQAGDRDGVYVMFNREVVGMPDQETQFQRAQANYATKLVSIHTIVFEAQALQSYEFDPAKFSPVTIPVLLLLGGDSPAHFRESTEALHGAMPHSRIVVFPGQRHIAMDMMPDIFVREVTAFLNE